MSRFEYARPETETEALVLLNDYPGESMILAGGTDALNLIKQEIVQPRRVVDIKRVRGLNDIEENPGGLLIGAAVTLETVRNHPAFTSYLSVERIINNIHSGAIRSMGTLVGDLCHHPNCWYYRNAHGLLARDERDSLPVMGRSRYHAILGNEGPAKYVSASRLAPALIAMGAKIRIVGPHLQQETWLPVKKFYRVPNIATQGTTILEPGQLITHLWLPRLSSNLQLASYEVLPSAGLDWPSVAASVAVEYAGDIVSHACVVLGHVAPAPWIAREAESILIGRAMTDVTALLAAEAASADANPLPENRYKVQQCKAAVKRALLQTTKASELT